MKLLFDQNISFRILKKLEDHYPESAQVKRLGLANKEDRPSWNYAKREGYTIVTFDADFFDLANLYGHPPKIIWLRTGNTRTEDLANLLKERFEIIQAFINDLGFEEVACLELE